MNTPWGDLKGHIKSISEKSHHKDKYEFLLGKIEDIPEDVKMEAIYLAPAGAYPLFKSSFQSATSKMVGIEFKKEWERWRFLSLENFATSEKVQTKFQTEWRHLAEALKSI
jgi:hypothetical protein